MVVHCLDAQIEVRDRRPHSARADLPERPAGRAAGGRSGRAEHVAGGVAVLELAVRAVEGGLPLRVPEVLVAASDAPALRLVEAVVGDNCISLLADKVARTNRTRNRVVVGQSDA